MLTNFLGQNIKTLRKKRRVSQAAIALEIKKGQTTVGNWETGVSQPNIEELDILSNYFGVSIDDLIKKNLADVHLNDKDKPEEKSENVHLNVHPTVHPIGENLQNSDDALEYWELNEPGPPKLLKGPKKGELLKVTMPKVITLDTSGEENAVLVPVRARAGYLAGYGDTKFIEKLPAFKVWGSVGRTYRIFEVDGNSMFDTIHDRDKVKGYWVGLSAIKDGRVYVLVTKSDGIIIKRVINRYEEEKLICKSDNNHRGEWPPLVVDIHDVMEVWEVEEVASKNLGEPGEWYKRMINLEADVAILKQQLLKST